MIESLQLKKEWSVAKYYVDQNGAPLPQPFATVRFDGNVILNEGITALADLIAATEGGTATKFDNAHAYMGVGDSSDTALATQTGLQASANKLYKAMDATYPQRSGQTIIWRATFLSNEANFDWYEVTVANGASDAAENLNRKVSTIGTKTELMQWVLELRLTIS